MRVAGGGAGAGRAADGQLWRVEGWRGAREWGRNLLPSGPVVGGESHPSPFRLQPGWQLPGAEKERSGLRDLQWTVFYPGTGLCGSG